MRISTADFVRGFGTWVDQAMSAPVMVTKHGRDRLVILSAEEYGRLTRKSRRVVRTRDLSAGDQALFGVAEPSNEFAHDDSRRRGSAR